MQQRNQGNLDRYSFSDNIQERSKDGDSINLFIAGYQNGIMIKIRVIILLNGGPASWTLFVIIFDFKWMVK